MGQDVIAPRSPLPFRTFSHAATTAVLVGLVTGLSLGARRAWAVGCRPGSPRMTNSARPLHAIGRWLAHTRSIWRLWLVIPELYPVRHGTGTLLFSVHVSIRNSSDSGGPIGRATTMPLSVPNVNR